MGKIKRTYFLEDETEILGTTFDTPFALETEIKLDDGRKLSVRTLFAAAWVANIGRGAEKAKTSAQFGPGQKVDISELQITLEAESLVQAIENHERLVNIALKY